MTEYQGNVCALSERTILNGHFHIQEVLGVGGFGITYRAIDKHLDRVVAIKEFFPGAWVSRNTTYSATVVPVSAKHGQLFTSMKEKFIEEAKTMAKLDSSNNVVKVYSYFEENETAYIVMEFLDGVTLKKHVEKYGKMNPDELCKLIIPLIRALNIVHSYKLIHRDIAPDNIMLMPDRTLKLMDFGAARSFNDDTQKSMSVILKHGFAPFEQYQRRGNQGTWTDIYALSATIYYCITASIPESAADRIANDSLKLPSELGIVIRPAIQNALMKGMAKLAEDRYQTALEMATAFDEAMFGISPMIHAGQGGTVVLDEEQTNNPAEVIALSEEPNHLQSNHNQQAPSKNEEKNERQNNVSQPSIKNKNHTKLLLIMAIIVVLGYAGFAALNQVGQKDSKETLMASTSADPENLPVQTEYVLPAESPKQNERKEADETTPSKTIIDKPTDKLAEKTTQPTDKSPNAPTNAPTSGPTNTPTNAPTNTPANTPVSLMEIRPVTSLTAASPINVGDIVTFGVYYPDMNVASPAGEADNIYWKVLQRQGNSMLLISEQVLDYRPYHDTATAVTWKESSLRSWLNNEFLRDAFSDSELKSILIYEDDYVRLLSVDQMEEFLTNEEDRWATPTESANRKQKPLKNGRCWWWLLSEKESVLAPSIDGAGGCHASVDSVIKKSNGVRPCIFINLAD